MPELSEHMYCSEQICIPPTFPYLLRQYAKAAIRTQPTDLLRWSTAYFRCLSLNLPPPVKPRLEYPVPRDHCGVTPGWLRALMIQLPCNETVNFKILWDRWTGSCLKHETLIEILCLAGFTDPFAIPWLRFIAICAAHLTENLTQTMILICEILTEEPEGGSAMITVEVFKDLYQFLAAIDASKPQTLKNLYFTDSLLSLYQEAPKAEVVEVAEEVQSEGPEESVAPEEVSEEGPQVTEVAEEDLSVVSCPDIAADEIKEGDDLEKYAGMESAETIITGQTSGYIEMLKQGSQPPTEEVDIPAEKGDDTASVNLSLKQQPVVVTAEVEEPTISLTETASVANPSTAAEEPQPQPEPPAEPDQQSVQAEGSVGAPASEGGPSKTEEEMNIQEYESQETLPPMDVVPVVPSSAPAQESMEEEKEEEEAPKDEVPDQELELDLQKLRDAQLAEIPGEEDYELEKYKIQLMQEMPLTKSQEEALHKYKICPDYEVDGEGEEGEGELLESEAERQKRLLQREYEDVFVDAVPGIGATVPPHLVNVVNMYMDEMAKEQHGMVMPRNIRHYRCPPLEVVK